MNKHSGFTLIELIIVLVIAGIMAAFAAPNMGVFLLNSARSTNLNSLVTAINMARSEAIKRGSTISVCESSAPFTACNAVSGNFTQGWIVRLDSDNTVLRVFDPDLGGNTTILAQEAGVGTPDLGILTYQPSGFSTLEDGANFTYCDKRGTSAARAVLISTTGHPRISRDTNGDGTHEDFGGNDLTCP